MFERVLKSNRSWRAFVRRRIRVPIVSPHAACRSPGTAASNCVSSVAKSKIFHDCRRGLGRVIIDQFRRWSRRRHIRSATVKRTIHLQWSTSRCYFTAAIRRVGKSFRCHRLLYHDGEIKTSISLFPPSERSEWRRWCFVPCVSVCLCVYVKQTSDNIIETPNGLQIWQAYFQGVPIWPFSNFRNFFGC